MTYEEILRRACERTGLEIADKPIAPGWEAGAHKPGCVWWYDDDDPALESYVADRLQLEAVATALFRPTLFELMQRPSRHWNYEACLERASPRTRILAAMVALGELTLEKAREAGE